MKIIAGILLFAAALCGQNIDSVKRNQYHPAAQPLTCDLGDTWFNPSPATAGQNWYGCTAPNTWTVMSGSGAVAACDDATLTSGAVTVFVNATSTNKCTYTFNSTPKQIGAPIAVSNPTGSDVFYFGVTPAGALVVGASSASATCASCSAVLTGVSTFHGLGADVRPLYTAASTGTSWTGTLGNFRALQSTNPVTAGAGLISADSGSSTQFSTNSTTLIGLWTGCSGILYLGADGACHAASGGTAPLADFADHASTSSTSSQGLGSGLTIASGAISSTGKLTEIKGAFLITAFNTHGTAYALQVGGVPVTVLNGIAAGSLSGTTLYFDCELQTTAASTVRASCVSGEGQNVAVPYINVTDNTITLSGTVLVQFVTTTDGTVGTITQKSLEVIARNY